jgi:hypothetical protein
MMMRRPVNVAMVAAACAVALAACSGSGTPSPHKDAGPAPDSGPEPDGGLPRDAGTDADGAGPQAGGITLWLAPNGSEVVLQLLPAQPTVPF